MFASAKWNMTAGSAIEILSTADNAGTESINLRGNELSNTVAGNAGANIISGGAGNDTLLPGGTSKTREVLLREAAFYAKHLNPLAERSELWEASEIRDFVIRFH